MICFPQRKLNYSVIPAPQILYNSIKFSVFFTDGRCGEFFFVIQAVGGVTPEKTRTQENLRANKLRSHPSAQFF